MRLAVVSTTGSQEFATMANLYQWSARQAKAAAALPKPQSTHPPPHPGKLGIAQRVGPIAGIWDHDCRTSSRCICSRASTMLPDGKASVSARPRLALPSQLQVQASADCRSPHTTVCRHDAQGTSTRWQVVSLSICLLYNTMLSTLTIRCTRHAGPADITLSKQASRARMAVRRVVCCAFCCFSCTRLYPTSCRHLRSAFVCSDNCG